MGNIIHNLSIKKTLTIVMGALVLFMLLLSALSIIINKNGSKSLHEIAETGVVQMNAINRTEANLTQANASTREYLKAWGDDENTSEVNRWKQEAEASLVAAQRRLEEFNSIVPPSGSEREALASAANQIHHTYTQQLNKVLQASTLNAANSEWLQVMNTRREFQTAVRNFVQLTEQRTTEILAADDRNSRLSLVATLFIVGFALIMVVAARMVIVRAIVNPINSTVEYLTAIAKGDLTQRIQQLGRNEIGVLLQGLQEMQLQLTDIVQMLKSWFHRISAALWITQ